MEKKEEFLELLSSVERPGIDDLVQYICGTDFFEAPASSNYHNAVKGGLCSHSLNVYYNMVKLRDMFYPDMHDDTVKITALLHDISKVEFYEEYAQNKKVYSEDGSKRDELGKFDWQSVKAYKTRDYINREFICGEHGVNSFLIINDYIKLTEGERAAIINHHIGLDNGFAMKDLNECLNRYPTLLLLHMADMTAVYLDENPYSVDE